MDSFFNGYPKIVILFAKLFFERTFYIGCQEFIKNLFKVKQS